MWSQQRFLMTTKCSDCLKGVWKQRRLFEFSARADHDFVARRQLRDGIKTVVLWPSNRVTWFGSFEPTAKREDPQMIPLLFPISVRHHQPLEQDSHWHAFNLNHETQLNTIQAWLEANESSGTTNIKEWRRTIHSPRRWPRSPYCNSSSPQHRVTFRWICRSSFRPSGKSDSAIRSGYHSKSRTGDTRASHERQSNSSCSWIKQIQFSPWFQHAFWLYYRWICGPRGHWRTHWLLQGWQYSQPGRWTRFRQSAGCRGIHDFSVSKTRFTSCDRR